MATRSTGSIDTATGRFHGLQCLWFAAAVICGAALAWLAAPTVFRALPTDMTRTSVILDALDASAKAGTSPRLVMFGSSVAMASGNMAVVTAGLPDNPSGWNLASTGQSPLESYLYYQQLPAATDVIIQMIDPNTVTKWDALDAQKYNTFYMFGYRPDERTRERMTTIFGARMGNIFTKSGFTQRFESRWVVRQIADRMVRGLLRDDLEIDRATNDLVFPNSGARKQPPDLINQQIADKFDDNPDEYYAKPTKMEFLGEMVERARTQEKQIIFLLMPVHPEQYKYRGKQFFDGARTTFAKFGAAYGVPVLDGIDVVPRDEYVDTLHPSEAGGDIFSAWLAQQLQELRSSGEVSF